MNDDAGDNRPTAIGHKFALGSEKNDVLFHTTTIAYSVVGGVVRNACAVFDSDD